MRLFPRTASQRLAAATVATALALGAVAVPLANAGDLKNRHKHAEHQVSSAKQDLDESSSALVAATRKVAAAKALLADANAELADVRTRLAAAQVLDNQMQAKLVTAEQRLTDSRQQLTDGQAALELQRQHVTATVTSIYEQGDPQLLAFASMLNAETPADLTSRMQATDVIVGRETGAYDDLHAAEVLLQVRENEVESAKNDVADQRRAAAAHLDTMRALHEETRQAKAKVRDLVDSRKAAAKQAWAARRHDSQVLRQAKAKEHRIQQHILALARRAAQRAARRGAGAGYTGSSGGFLMRPVNGPVTSPFGWRIHPIYGYWGLHDGTDFGVSCGEGLWAAAGGTVVSEYYSSVYGNRLYLNVGTVNGKNVTVVYNHMSGYRSHTGDHVRRGEVVGYVGDTGWSTGCHLHFTVLVNGTAVDPMNWF
ncbi:peptidoglycan DD-metalloendopeptidase family protein [Nocardioides sp.]|uniref:peptidoglycan DD-metalloendopeptidase family protein n=1 Tax=Nocardioides sp. TaxID=35761 RepID=UPI0031FE83D9|nr:peptidase [Nocardioides sp.]